MNCLTAAHRAQPHKRWSNTSSIQEPFSGVPKMYFSDNSMALIVLGRAQYSTYSQIEYIIFVQSFKNLGIVCVLRALSSSRCGVNGYSSCWMAVIWALPLYFWLLITESYQPKACGSPLNSRSAISWTPHPAIECNEKVWQQQSNELIEIRSSELQNKLSLIPLIFKFKQCSIIKILRNQTLLCHK